MHLEFVEIDYLAISRKFLLRLRHKARFLEITSLLLSLDGGIGVKVYNRVRNRGADVTCLRIIILVKLRVNNVSIFECLRWFLGSRISFLSEDIDSNLRLGVGWKLLRFRKLGHRIEIRVDSSWELVQSLEDLIRVALLLFGCRGRSGLFGKSRLIRSFAFKRGISCHPFLGAIRLMLIFLCHFLCVIADVIVVHVFKLAHVDSCEVALLCLGYSLVQRILCVLSESKILHLTLGKWGFPRYIGPSLGNASLRSLLHLWLVICAIQEIRWFFLSNHPVSLHFANLGRSSDIRFRFGVIFIQSAQQIQIAFIDLFDNIA